MEHTVTVDDDGTVVGDIAKIVLPDVTASNGIVHVVDRILDVPTMKELVDTKAGFSAFQAFTLALTEATDITLFGVSDLGLLQLQLQFPLLVNALAAQDEGFSLHIENLLSLHLLNEVIFSEDIFDGAVVTAANGEDITFSVASPPPPGTTGVTISPSASAFGVTNILTVDEITTQGVFHSLDSLLQPLFLTRTIVTIAEDRTSILASLIVLAGLDSLATDFDLTRT